MVTGEGYIAVFDSGVGGISVLRQLRKRMPRENYVYFGDSAHAPYGAKTTREVRQLTLEAAAGILERYPVKALVVACNTATAAAIDLLRETYPDLIVIGIEPALKAAADHFPGGHIGIMATDVTLREEKLCKLIDRFSDCTVEKIHAPGLVELIEAGKADAPETENLLRPILTPYVEKLDALVLGCTHYPFAAPAIRRILGPGTALIDGGEGTARETMRRLEEKNLLYSGTGRVIWENSLHTRAMLDLSVSLLNHPQDPEEAHV